MTQVVRSSGMNDEQNEQQEARSHGESHDVSRRALFRRSAVVAAVAAPIGAFAFISRTQAAPAVRGAAPQPAAQRDAQTMAGLKTASSQGGYFQEIMTDENAHVDFLKKALGSNARPKPTFKGLEQSSASSFTTLSRTFENVGVGAYLLAAPSIQSKDYLSAAASILTIEARHAGFLDSLTGAALSPNGAFDKPIQQGEIVNDVSPFIASLNGGSDPSGKLGSDTDILNFALLLEYLEAEFYNINVPKFYGGSVPGNG